MDMELNGKFIIGKRSPKKKKKILFYILLSTTTDHNHNGNYFIIFIKFKKKKQTKIRKFHIHTLTCGVHVSNFFQ